MDLLKSYHHKMTPENLFDLVKALTLRIKDESVQCLERGDSVDSICITKCWNIIRTIFEMKHQQTNLPQFQEVLLPLFQYLESVSSVKSITFDDELVLVIKTFIKKSKNVSETMWKLFPYLSNVFEKSKHVFNHLLETYNAYLTYGGAYLGQHPTEVARLVNIGILSMNA